MRGEWQPFLYRNESTGSGYMPKIVEVPSFKEWKVDWIYAAYTVTSTSAGISASSGAHVFAMNIQDASSNVYFKERFDIGPDNGQTRYYRMFHAANADTAMQSSDWLTRPLPELYLKAGENLKFYDESSASTVSHLDDIKIYLGGRSRTTILAT